MWDDIGKFLETVGAMAGQSMARNAERQPGIHTGLIPALMEAPAMMSAKSQYKAELAKRQAAAQQFLAARGLTGPQAQAGAQLVASGTPISSLIPKAASRTPIDTYTFAARQLGISPDPTTWTPAQANAVEAQIVKNRPAGATAKVNLGGFNGYLAANGVDPTHYTALPADQKKSLYGGYQQQLLAQARARALPLPPELLPTTADGMSGVVPIPRVRGATSVTPGKFVPLGPDVVAGKPTKPSEPKLVTRNRPGPDGNMWAVTYDMSDPKSPTPVDVSYPTGAKGVYKAGGFFGSGVGGTPVAPPSLSYFAPRTTGRSMPLGPKPIGKTTKPAGTYEKDGKRFRVDAAGNVYGAD